MGYSVSRLTLYAILSAIEEDLRELIVLHLSSMSSPKEILGADNYEKALERARKEQIEVESDDLSINSLLYYMDYSETYKLLNRNRSHLPAQIAKYIKNITPKLEQLVPIRNRVAHSRPLKYEDLSTTVDVANSIVTTRLVSWNELTLTLEKLRDEPSFVLTLEIPRIDNETVSHNLPIPDFDETGFLGREQHVKDLTKLCVGAYPVITIIGDGGVGKTALALRVAYDLLDLPNTPFEAIVWTTSKSRQLTPQEIINIEGAITDSLGMFQDLATNLVGQETHQPLEEILSYLQEFRILLILDNLETVLDERIRGFLGNLPSGSKVLITSRIGLGAFEYPVKLDSMNSSEAVELVRALARIRGVSELTKMENARLEKYCAKMQNSPGFIKWFVSAVQAGSRPEEVLDRPEIFLDFCMSNVYEYLTPASKIVLNAMLCVPGHHSQAELAFLTQMDVLELQSALQQLMTTNMVHMLSLPSVSSFTSQYELGDLPRDYLAKHHSPSPEEYGQFTSRRRQLVAQEERAKAAQRTDPYSPWNIFVRTPGDLVVARYLRRGQELTQRHSWSDADKQIQKARSLAPEYFEVHRVEAWLRVSQRNMTAARLAYEAAIELEPNHAPLLVWYAEFLLRYLDDTETALEVYRQAANIDPKAFDVQWGVARASLYLLRFDIAQQAINALIEIADSLPVEKLRKVYDLYLQIFRRQADHYVNHKQYQEAVNTLYSLKQVFEKCPPAVIDNRIREILKKGAREAEICAANIIDQGQVSEILALRDWLMSEATKTTRGTTDPQIGQSMQGHIVKLTYGQFYGFLKSTTGQEFFFHRNDMYDVTDWNSLEIGTTVEFAISNNEQGLCAVGVRII